MIESSRLRWLGLVERREGALLNELYRGNTGERRSVGRLKNTWLGNLMDDFRERGDHNF